MRVSPPTLSLWPLDLWHALSAAPLLLSCCLCCSSWTAGTSATVPPPPTAITRARDDQRPAKGTAGACEGQKKKWHNRELRVLSSNSSERGRPSLSRSKRTREIGWTCTDLLIAPAPDSGWDQRNARAACSAHRGVRGAAGCWAHTPHRTHARAPERYRHRR